MQEQQAAFVERHQHTSTPATSPLSAPPPVKMEYEKFSAEVEKWNTRSSMYQAHLAALGCTDAITESQDEEVKFGRGDFDSNGVPPERLRKANQVWVSLITSCKGVAFEIISGSESPSEAWSQLVQY